MLDAICTRYPGYTLSSARAEDAQLVYRTSGLLATQRDD